MAIHSNHPRAFGWRAAGITLSAMLFALSIAQLIVRPGHDTAVWRCFALASLYLLICLTQRRLFAPTRTRRNRRLHQ